MKNPFLVVLVFLGVFLCGGVVGGAVSIHYYERFVREKGAERFLSGGMMREFNEKLAITPEQRKQLRTIFSRSMEDQRAARKQFDVISDRMRADFESVLTPEQRAKYKELRAQMRAAREQREKEREKEREKRPGQPGEGRQGLPMFLERRERERERSESGGEMPPPPPAREPAPASGDEGKQPSASP